jgi:hypothetical protein
VRESLGVRNNIGDREVLGLGVKESLGVCEGFRSLGKALESGRGFRSLEGIGSLQ